MRNSRLWITITLVVVGVSALALAAYFLMTRQESTAESGDSLVESGRAHLDAGEYAEAIADLKAAIDQDPGNSEGYFLLGQAYNNAGDLLSAKDAFSKVIELDPENAAAHHNLGVTYFQLRAPDAAIAEFKTALELDPDDPYTHYQLGAVYLNMALPAANPMAAPDQGLLEQANAEFEAALSLKQDMPEALIGLANIHIQQGEYASAVGFLERAVEQMPDSPEAYYALGRAHAQSGNVDEACEAYARTLELDLPSDWQVQTEEEMGMLGCP